MAFLHKFKVYAQNISLGSKRRMKLFSSRFFVVALAFFVVQCCGLVKEAPDGSVCFNG
jgi:hypothetical protein